MKKKFKYLLLSSSLLFIFPLITNAASLSFNGSPSNSTATYEIKYNPEGSTYDSISIKLDKTNDDLTYNLNSDLVKCENLQCNNIVTGAYDSEITIATLTVQNTTGDSQKTTLTLSGSSTGGEITGTTKDFTLKPVSTTTTTQKVLNTDNNLSSINLSVGTMDQTFNKDIKEYTVTGIKDTINSVTITPTCAAEGCTWSMSCPLGECSVTTPTSNGRVALQTGANKVSIVVTSEDKQSNKTYILNIYRGEVVSSSAYLSGLEIEDATLSPAFDSMTNDYTLSVGMDIDKLDIITTTEDPSATVVVKGNENLKVGENTITITVTSSDGESKQVYTLIVTKEDLEDDSKEKEEINTSKVEKKKNNTWLIILLSVLGLGLIVVAFLIIFKKKKNNKNNKDKNDKNNKGTPTKSDDTEVLEKALVDDLMNTSEIEKENTANLNILNETKRQLNDEPKQDIDEALDDLMKTKKLELGDLDF